MADVVVTVPKTFGLKKWIEEGQLPGEPDNGLEYFFYLAGRKPDIKPGERVYIVCEERLRGYAPLVRLEVYDGGRFSLVRRGGAVACTLHVAIVGFRGWRYRWWMLTDERPFMNWTKP